MPAVLKNRKGGRRRLALLLVALAVLGGVAYWGQGRLEARRHWRAARAALDTQDLEGARRHLAEAVRYWPADTEVRLRAARAARQAGAYEEAEEHLTQCERLQDRNFRKEVWFERLLFRAQLGETEELRRVAAGIDDADVERTVLALEALAQGYAASLADSETRRFVDALLERSPGHVQGLLLKAHLLDKNLQEEEALECCAQVTAKLPHALEPRLLMAKLLMRLGRRREAIQLYEGLRQDYPGHSEVLYRLAQCRVDEGQLDDAAALLDDLLGRSPDHVEGLVERGRLDLRRDNPREAVLYLRRARAAAPRHTEALETLAQCLTAEGPQHEADEARAQKEQEEISYGRLALRMRRVEEGPPDPVALEAIAGDLMRLGKEQDGLTWYWCTLRVQPHRATAHQALAAYFDRSGQPYRAARHREWAELAGERPSE